LEPSNPASYVELGQAYMKASRYGEAVPVLNRALELDPDLLTAHRLLGYALLTQGYAADACPHLEQAGDRGALGIAQIETNKFADAAANLRPLWPPRRTIPTYSTIWDRPAIYSGASPSQARLRRCHHPHKPSYNRNRDANVVR
jgi:Flp pilus assembly protein TadD